MRGGRPELFRRAGSLISMVGTMVIHLAGKGVPGEAKVEIAALSKALAKPDTTEGVKASANESVRGNAKAIRGAEMLAVRKAHASLIGVAGGLGVLFLLGEGYTQGQDDSNFSLFEPVESTSNADSSESRRQRSRVTADGSASGPEFSLIGTARIGSQISVLLRHVSGEEVRVSLEYTRTPIPSYEQYALLGSEGDSVSIQYPQSVACAEFAAQGVSCDASRNVARLSLTTAKAIAPSAVQVDTAQSDAQQEEDQVAPINPFEALRNRAQNGEPTLGRPDRFQPRRIDPADVPPGMRVVSTPFGDRLVEE